MNADKLCCLWLALTCPQLAAESLVLVSDLNGRYGSTTYDSRVSEAIYTIVELQPELVISTGDMVAGQKQPDLDSEGLDLMWAGFNRVVTDPLRQAGIPFTVAVGNHDGSAFPAFALEREHFEKQWRSRVPELDILPGSEWPRRYAARMDGLFLLAFDGTLPGKLPEAERQFVERMLQSYSHKATATIVFSHLPMWPFTKGREQDTLDDPEFLSLLHENGVDVYASGHHHAFYAGIDDAGMVHLSVGALGGNARAFSGGNKRQPFSYAIVNIADGMVSISSRAAPEFRQEVPPANLPETMVGPLGKLQRYETPVPLRP